MQYYIQVIVYTVHVSVTVITLSDAEGLATVHPKEVHLILFKLTDSLWLKLLHALEIDIGGQINNISVTKHVLLAIYTP